MSTEDTVPPGDATRRLRGLEDGVVVPPPRSAASARRTAGRRHAGRVAGAALLVATVVVGVPVGMSLGGTSAAPLEVATQEPQEVATQPSAPAEQPSPPAVADPPSSVVPTDEPSAAPSAEPPVDEPAPVPLVVVGTEQGPSYAGELAGLPLFTEELLPEGDMGGPDGWDVGTCGSAGTPGDELRTGWAAQSVYGGDAGSSVMVAAYPDEATAARVVAALGERAAACWRDVVPLFPGGPVTTTYWLEQSRSATAITGTVRFYHELDEAEQARVDAGVVDGYAPVVIRSGQVVAAASDGRHVALVVTSDDYGGGNILAELAGDTRPGAGTPFTEGEGARISVEGSLRNAQSEAVRLAGAARELADS